VAYPILARTDATIKATFEFFVDFGLLPMITTAATTSAPKLPDSWKSEGVIRFRAYAGGVLHGLEIRRVEASSPFATSGLMGFAFVAASLDDLQKLATEHPDVLVPGVQPAPVTGGGGSLVTLRDPDGSLVEVRCGFEPLEPLLMRGAKALITTENPDARPANAPIRPVYGPPEVVRLAHCVYFGAEILRTMAWYQHAFGFIVSDFQFTADPQDHRPVVAFMRVDRGAEPVEHHVFAVVSAPKAHVPSLEHVAYTVQDFDAIGEGYRYLEMRRDLGAKYTSAWGIGRHLLGSNIFDYWREPMGQMFEHTGDTDRLTSDFETGYWNFTSTAQHSWGPPPHSSFLEADGALGLVKGVLTRAISRSGDFGGLQGLRRAAYMGAAGSRAVKHTELEQYLAMRSRL
jgi:hypothetical protein